MCSQYGEIIAFQRKKLNLSLQDLGNVVGYTAQAISRFEKGIVQIDMRLWGDLCKALDISVRSFLVGDINALAPWESGEATFNEKRFCESIRYSRDRLLLSKKDLATKLSINPQKISKWEKGASLPSIKEFIDLANLFEYDYEDFYFSKTKEEDKDLDMPVPALKGGKRLGKGGIIALSVLSGLLVSSFAFNVYQSLTIDGFDASSSSKDDISIDPIQEEYFTVTYHYRETGEAKEKQVRKGDLVPYLDYSLKGHYLVGYEDSKGVKWNFASHSVLEDVDLYGIFKKETYQITFKEAIGGVTLKQETVEYLSSATPPSLIPKAGYNYEWVGQYKNVTQNATIYPKWGLNIVTLKIELDEGESFKNSSSKEWVFDKYSADSFPLLPEVQKEGYLQDGYTYKGQPFTKETVLEDNMVLHASWIKNEFHYRFNHSSLEKESRVASYGEVINSLPTPIEEGKEFDYWSIDRKKIELPWTYSYKEDVLLEPNWKGIKFHYDIDRYGKLTINSITDIVGDTVTIPAEIDGTPISLIKKGALSDSSQVKVLNILGDGMEIEDGAFDRLTSLEEIHFPNITEKTVFHKYIFNGCRAIKRIETGRPSLYQGDYDRSLASLRDFGIIGNQNSPLEVKISNNAEHNLVSFFFGSIYIGKIEFGDKQIEISANNLNLQTENLKELVFSANLNAIYYFDAKNLDMDDFVLQNLSSSLSVIYSSFGGRIGNFNVIAEKLSLNNVRFLNVKNLVLNNTKGINFLDNVHIEAENIYLPSDGFSFSENIDGPVFYAPTEKGINVHFFGTDQLPSKLENRNWIDTTCPVNYIFHPSF